MKLFDIHHDVISGQCKNALLRIQIRYTAIFLFPNLICGWVGSSIGIFSPKRTIQGYRLTNFHFHPWLYPDIVVCNIPRWYKYIVNKISIGEIE